jgi:hypothetical protein
MGAMTMRDLYGPWSLHVLDIGRGTALLFVVAMAALRPGVDERQRSESGARASKPLRGSIHLRIDDPANLRRRNLRLDQEAALPLKAHDRFRIEAKLNRPAYLYVFWIGSDGKLGPIYPWISHHGDRPAQEVKTDRLDLPPKTDTAWEIPPGEPGLEAVVLMARAECPLPRDVDLAKLLAGPPAPRRPSLEKAVWIENGREVSLDSHDRAAPSTRTRKSDDPVLRFRRLLQDKVQPLGDYSQTVLFPNEGGQ